MGVLWKQFHQTTKHVHDCHYDEHSLPVIGLMFMMFFNEWLTTLLGFSTQLILLHFDVVH
jgi:hypothetical protein